jgi:hypothetical protein
MTRHACPPPNLSNQVLRLANESKLPAKYEVLPQDPQSVCLAAFTAEPSAGGIPARGEQLVEFTLRTERLGRIQLPVRVRVVGSRAKVRLTSQKLMSKAPKAPPKGASALLYLLLTSDALDVRGCMCYAVQASAHSISDGQRQLPCHACDSGL